MKIEMGESLLQSYLKHIEHCLISQTNWKTSSNWNIESSCRDQIKYIYNKIRSNNQFSDVFKKNELDQILKQAEIDVIGFNNANTVFMVEVAFHEGGLNYGSKIETKNKIFEKLLRAYLIGLAYFPNKELKIIFATPKTNPATKEIIDDYFELLERAFSSDTVHFQFITNENFKNNILIPTLKITSSDADTGELFLRSYKLLNMFDLANKTETYSITKQIQNEDFNLDKILNMTNSQISVSTPSSINNSLMSPPKIEFYISDKLVTKSVFNEVLLKIKQSRRIWFYNNGSQKEEIWNANNFTEDSNLMANIKTSATYRKWKEKGIIKVEFRIN
ncbi:MAG: hypothetical protein J6R96_04335 [Spirochaetaceae bacterium]|nr:hypothetical protein [Spirochaetaceae bacterium]MBO7174964.1 hypothetical protein [Spirochaetaceae bacterium]